MRLLIQLPLLLTLSCLLVVASIAADAHAEVELGDFLVTLLEDIEVPAEAPGVVAALEAREGMSVTADQVVGKLDDRQARANHKLTSIELESSKEQAKNDIAIRFAREQLENSEIDLEKAKAANQKRPGVVPQSEIRKLQLAVVRATLGIEQAAMDQKLLTYTVDGNEAKLALAKEEVWRRQIRSPLEGIILEVRRKKGEWVRDGDSVLRIVRMDRLRVEGFVNINDFRREQIADQSIVAMVDLGGGRAASFQ
ncbi:MAG TPA: HlyD family efflux transporter periplasmic adaptor subunit, partial [Pirellulales bacterium]|nr:HlyD family efflux transporter periplasmic adaptor subunit [Pirellulales bacterium]